MYRNPFAIGWAKHVVDELARVVVPKANPSLSSPLSMRSTKRILYGLTVAHAQ